MLFLAAALFFASQELKPQFDISALERLRQAAEKTDSSTLAINFEGKLVGEWYFDGPARPIEIQSITKAVSALVFGAVADVKGVELLNMPVSTWYPEWRQGRKRNVLVRHILAHTTGMQDVASSAEEIAPAPDILALALAGDLEKEPGTQFRYSNKASNLLAGIIFHAFDEPIDVLAKRHLFAPLGIEDYVWQKDLNQTPYIMGGLMMTARDMLKLGQLILDGGKWRGQQIVSKDWLNELGRAGPYKGHGLFWWIENPSCKFWEIKTSPSPKVLVARGWRGQYIIVSPSQKLVVVRQYDIRRGADNVRNDFPDFEELARNLVPMCQSF